MQELWKAAVAWVTAHWFDLAMAGVAIFVLKGLFRQPLDDRGRLIKDPNKRPSKYGWLLGTGLVSAYFAVRIFGNVGLENFKGISAMKFVWSLLILAFYAVLFYIANKKEFTGQTIYLRGLYGSIAWSLSLVIFIFFGFSWWALALAIFGLALRHAYTVPNRRRGVGVWFGKWLVRRDVGDRPDTPSYHRTIWTNRNVCLEPGLTFLILPFDMPGWDIRIVIDELRYVGTRKKPEFTPEFNAKPNPEVKDEVTGKVISKADPIGGIVKFQYFGRFRTGKNLSRLRKLPDDVREHPEDHVVARVIKCLRFFAGQYTVAEHLSLKNTVEYKNGLKVIMEEMYEDVANEFAVDEIYFEVLDPEPSDAVRQEVEKVAAADQKIISRRKLGEAAGAEIGAQIDAVEKRMQTPAGAAAMAALIEMKRAENARTIVVDRSLGGAAAKLFGSEGESSPKPPKK